MKKALLFFAVSMLISLPVLAALKVGDKAPDFSARGSLGGKEFDFSLQEALKKGPVVVYFFPSAYTKGCDLEAHTFSTEKDKFDAAGASIIGVSADSIARLNRFAADPDGQGLVHGRPPPAISVRVKMRRFSTQYAQSECTISHDSHPSTQIPPMLKLRLRRLPGIARIMYAVM